MRTPYLVLFAVELTRVLTLPHRNLSLALINTQMPRDAGSGEFEVR